MNILSLHKNNDLCGKLLYKGGCKLLGCKFRGFR